MQMQTREGIEGAWWGSIGASHLAVSVGGLIAVLRETREQRFDSELSRKMLDALGGAIHCFEAAAKDLDQWREGQRLSGETISRDG